MRNRRFELQLAILQSLLYSPLHRDFALCIHPKAFRLDYDRASFSSLLHYQTKKWVRKGYLSGVLRCMHWDQKVISLQYTVGTGKASQNGCYRNVAFFLFFFFSLAQPRTNMTGRRLCTQVSSARKQRNLSNSPGYGGVE